MPYARKMRLRWWDRRRCPFAECERRHAFRDQRGLYIHLTDYHGILPAEIAPDAWGLPRDPFGQHFGRH